MHVLSSFLLATAAISSSFAAPLGSRQDDGVHAFDSSVSSPATRDVASLEPRAKKWIKINGYKLYLRERLGRGAFGDVYAADIKKKNKPGNGRQVAAKFVYEIEGTLEGPAMVHKAITDWTNIIKIITYGVVDDADVTVMEKANGPSLEGRIHGGDYSHQMTLKTDIMGMVRGLAVMHSSDLAHNDAHAGNVVFVDGVAKLIDFDETKKGRYHDSLCGGDDIMSPEALGLTQADHIDAFENDVWSAGVTLLRMIIGDEPWESAHDQLPKSIFAASLSDRATMLENHFPQASPNVCRVLAKVFAPQEERYSANDLYGALNNVDRFSNPPSSKMAIRADPNDEGKLDTPRNYDDEGKLDTPRNYVCTRNRGGGPNNRTVPSTSSVRVDNRASLFY